MMRKRLFNSDKNTTEESGLVPAKPRKKNRKGLKAVAAVSGCAVLFGLIGGATFQGVQYFTGNTISLANPIDKSDKAELQQVSDSGTVETDLTKLVKESMPFVVAIQNMTVEEVRDYFGGVQQQKQESVGSGIIIGQNDTELLIISNNHVVEGADTLTVTFNNEKSVEANIKGRDPEKDLAIVAVPLDKISSDTKSAIKTATLGDSNDLQVGEQVIAIGNALGYGQSVTNGIVSAKDREIDGYNGKLIQTNAAINPGNSGGALLNSKGEVVGINSAKISDSSVEGMGYAIPVSEVSDTIKKLMNQETKTKVNENERGSLGIQVMDIDEETAKAYGMPQGVYVADVTEGNDGNGLEKGYIITAINGTKVQTTNELQNELSYHKVGEKVTLTVQYPAEKAQYKEKDVTVTLIENTTNQ
nr:trypsin-like peptidase domain-containing protein [uncultured Sellimonas sp.]